MAASKALASSSRCNGCRPSLLRSFASMAGVEFPARELPVRGLLRLHQHPRAFSRAPQRFSDQPSPNELRRGEEELRTGIGDHFDDQEAPVPWYLQVDAPQRPLDAAHPLAGRQRIPELPENPPHILKDLFQHVSVDLGIDNLSLLDLRHLDPPPALGANLLMLFGTARSEKHLHVSADRLCRWLRSTYDLNPHADGLLGRNELKLKLRRKARKARIMSNAGASEGSLAADDGIRTGWICVNIGTIKAVESVPIVSQPEGFVGFGGQSERVSIVIQMFTEDKRAELDLENLWNGVLKTDRRRKEAQEEPELAPHNPNGAVFADQKAATYTQIPDHTPLQTRGFHTFNLARRHGTTTTLAGAREFALTNGWPRTWRASMSSSSAGVGVGLGEDCLNDPVQLLGRAAPGQNDQAIALANMLEELKNMSVEDRTAALGEGAGRYRSNGPFLKRFYSHIPEFPDIVHCEAIMELYLHALAIKHSGYSIQIVYNLIYEMQLAGLRVPERMFLSALSVTLSHELPKDLASAPTRRNKIIFFLLESMQSHSYPVLTDKIIMMLHDAFSFVPAEWADRDIIAQKRADYNTLVRHALLQRIDVLALPLKHSTFAHLLRSCGALGDMKGMWLVWSSIALNMMPRSAEMYADVLNAVTKTGRQVDCIDTLRYCVPEMEREIPAVELKGDVAEAVMRCVLVAEPEIEKLLSRGAQRGEWVKLWRRCQEALDGEEREGSDGGDAGGERVLAEGAWNLE